MKHNYRPMAIKRRKARLYVEAAVMVSLTALAVLLAAIVLPGG